MPGRPIAYYTRKEIVSAAHRLNNPLLSEEENKKLYSKCNHISGHGHNYTIEVTVKGPVSERTGMVMSFSELKRYMQEAIVDVMDHKNINVDVPHFQDHVATAENMCKFIWDSMAALMPDPSLLYQVRVAGGERNSVIYKGEQEEDEL